MNDTDSNSAWVDALARLHRWHSAGDGDAAREALGFIESELRLALPRTVPRRWPAEEVDDALQGFLARLLERPLPDSIHSSPGGYLVRAFRNRCLDIERGRRRSAAEPWEDESAHSASLQDVEGRDEVRRMTGALAQLRVEDRVALKLDAAPETLSDEEWHWLSVRTGLPQDEVRGRVFAADDVYALTLMFDPGPEPFDAKGRRDRMERFRKRRDRARDALWRVLGGER
jgi:DNA-directed RNA polymerase specialized sigma24 family protein